MDFVKGAVYALSLLLFFCIFTTVLFGFGVRTIRAMGTPDNLGYTEIHRRLALTSYAITWLVLVLIEGTFIIRYGFGPRPYLSGFADHLWFCAAPFFILLNLCVFVITGKHKQLKKWHKFLAYPCALLSIPMAITGDLLVYRLR
jgi:hypothetical protein